MLLLVFQSGAARYGLDTSQVVEVMPAASLRTVPRAERGVAGLLNHHGAIIPVLDITALLTGDPTRTRFSSRIVVVNFPGADGAIHHLGLLVERATETIRCSERDFQPAGIRMAEAPFSGDILVDREGTVQKIEISRLLNPELQRSLFAEAAANP